MSDDLAISPYSVGFVLTKRDLPQTAGKAIICYFNAGAMQTWDEDINDFPAEAKGKTLGGDYEDEWYVDIRHAKVVDIMKKRLTEAAAIGCDGVDPDNVDAWASGGEDRTGFNLQASDYVDYLTKLADHGHSLRTASGAPLLVGQKNAPDIASKLASTLDFAVLESCLDWNFCGDFQVYTQLGKPVFQIEYPKSIPASGVLSPADKALYCGEHETSDSDRGFSKLLKYASAQLDGWGQYCGEDSWKTPTLEE
jgi:hypothetical protein